MSDMNPPTNDIESNTRPGVESFGSVSKYSEAPVRAQIADALLRTIDPHPMRLADTIYEAADLAMPIAENYANTKQREWQTLVNSIDNCHACLSLSDDLKAEYDRLSASLTADTGGKNESI